MEYTLVKKNVYSHCFYKVIALVDCKCSKKKKKSKELVIRITIQEYHNFGYVEVNCTGLFIVIPHLMSIQPCRLEIQTLENSSAEHELWVQHLVSWFLELVSYGKSIFHSFSKTWVSFLVVGFSVLKVLWNIAGFILWPLLLLLFHGFSYACLKLTLLLSLLNQTKKVSTGELQYLKLISKTNEALHWKKCDARRKS